MKYENFLNNFCCDHALLNAALTLKRFNSFHLTPFEVGLMSFEFLICQRLYRKLLEIWRRTKGLLNYFSPFPYRKLYKIDDMNGSLLDLI